MPTENTQHNNLINSFLLTAIVHSHITLPNQSHKSAVMIFFQNHVLFLFKMYFQTYHLCIKQNVCPDLCPNCLQKLPADDTNRQRLKQYKNLWFKSRANAIGPFTSYKCPLHISLCLQGFLLSADFFFQKQLFQIILSGIPSEDQTAWIQIRPNILLGLIWIQSVCNGYQQTELTGKDVNNTNLWSKSKANARGFSTSYKIVFLFLVLTSTNSTVCQLYTVPSRLGPE